MIVHDRTRLIGRLAFFGMLCASGRTDRRVLFYATATISRNSMIWFSLLAKCPGYATLVRA
jgi:hypothetical protein